MDIVPDLGLSTLVAMPTQSQLCYWLWSEHQIWLWVEKDRFGVFCGCYRANNTVKGFYSSINDPYDCYEQALFSALTNIKTGNDNTTKNPLRNGR